MADKAGAHVEIYRRDGCEFCLGAEELLKSKGIPFQVYDIWKNPEFQSEMRQRADGRTTVPQIFVDGQGLGGFQELMTLETQGKLNALLGLP